MLDDMFDHMSALRYGPVWRPPSETARAAMADDLPWTAQALGDVHQSFLRDILPYSSGNGHPGFMGWVQGGGSPVGMLAEMLAAGMNANLGGRDHMAIEVERQIVRWMAELFRFPKDAGGLFLTGTSSANFCALLIARTRVMSAGVRRAGLGEIGPRLRAYTSVAAHNCIARGMEMAGLGSNSLRTVRTDAAHRIDLKALHTLIAEDRAAGLIPFAVIGTAGTVDVGAIDDLAGLAEIAALEGCHFHVDGAFGALGVLSPDVAGALKGIERADSIAFDFHKWAQVPYDAGFLLVRDAALQRRTFASDAAYLRRADSGLAGGEWWPCDLGPDLSRGFRALKTWFTLKTYGLEGLGAVITQSCALARALAARIDAEPELERMAPVATAIVCFRYRGDDALNASIVERLHREGHVAPSTTTIGGRTVIRAALFNHRTEASDIEALVDGVIAAGRALSANAAAA